MWNKSNCWSESLFFPRDGFVFSEFHHFSDRFFVLGVNLCGFHASVATLLGNFCKTWDQSLKASGGVFGRRSLLMDIQ